MDIVAALALVIALVALVLAVLTLRRSRPRRTGVDALPEDVHGLRQEVAALRAEASDALRHLAVVRYDAFGDMGGRMSFSAALLDDAGDGLVLTSINGRSETRTYAKGVKGGASDHTMSPEEQQAIAYATRAEVQPEEADLLGGSRRRRRG